MLSRKFAHPYRKTRNRHPFRAFCVVLFLLWISSAAGQVPRPRILTMDNGLPSTSIYSVLQDHDGFIWLGMLGKVCRYDGTNFATFDRGKELPFEAVQTMVQLDNGTILAGFIKSGFYRLDRDGWRKWETPWMTENQRLYCALKDREGRLWVGTQNGVWTFDDHHWTSWHDLHSRKPEPVQALFEDNAGRIWIGGVGSVYATEREHTDQYPLPAPATESRITVIGNGEGESVLAATSKGLFCISSDGHIQREDIPTEGIPFFTGILADNSGTIWITSLQGLFVQLNDHWIRMGTEDGLSGIRLWYPKMDREQNLWIPTQNNGVMIFPPPTILVMPEFKGAREDLVSDVLDDAHWGLLAGYGGHLVRWDGANWIEIDFPASAHPTEYILNCRRISPKSIIITGPNLLLQLNNDATMTDLIKQLKLPALGYHSPVNDALGRTWLPTYQNGILLLTDSSWSQFRAADGLPSDQIMSAVTLRNRDILLGSYEGKIIRIEAGEKGPGFREVLNLDTPILDMHQDDRGMIWIATAQKGVFCWDEQRVNPVLIEGMDSRTMTKVILTDDDMVIVGTENGLYVRKDNLWTNFGTSDGLPSRYFVSGSGCVDHAGNVYLGTLHGLCRLDRRGLQGNTQPVPARILDVMIDNQPVATEPFVDVPKGRREITVEFVGINFLNSDNLEYRYRLRPDDRKWTMTKSRLVSFRNLSPGDYQFDVQARLPGKAWGEADHTTLQVQAAIWDRKWFQLLAIALGILIVIRLAGLLKKLARGMLARHQKKWFSHYRLNRILGQGGFATVYEAVNTRTKDKVALKIIHEGVVSDERIETFLQEGLISASLADTNVVRILHHGTWNHRAYLECELVNGVSLQQRIEQNGPLPLNTATALFRCLLDIVSRIHEQDIVHRDLNARNIMIANPGLPENGRSVMEQVELVQNRIKILDFGLARFISSATRTQLETEAGTPAYLPPEFFFEHRKVNPAVDIYSLGVLFYFLMTGELPYEMPEDGSVYESIASVLYRDPVPVHHHRPEIPERLGKLIMDMIRKDAAERVADIGDIRQRLDDLTYHL